MENSSGYKYLMYQVNATGREKADGYYPKIMEEVYEWERDEVENIIWDQFENKGDTGVAIFLPKLKKYDGMTALKNFLLTCKIPSEKSLDVAKVLLEQTGDNKYLKIFEENLKDPNNIYRLKITARLSYCTPSSEIYKLLKKIYIFDKDDTVRSAAAKGLLHYKGYIKNILDLHENDGTLDLRRKFMLDNEKDREKMVEKLEKGELGWSTIN